jgi:hypothetical protein
MCLCVCISVVEMQDDDDEDGKEGTGEETRVTRKQRLDGLGGAGGAAGGAAAAISDAGSGLVDMQDVLLDTLENTKSVLNLKSKIEQLQQQVRDAEKEKDKLNAQMKLKNTELKNIKSDFSVFKRKVVGYVQSTLGMRLSLCGCFLSVSVRIQAGACISSTHTSVRQLLQVLL